MVVPTVEGVDSIVEYTLVSQPKFDDLDKLSNRIEKQSLQFINDIDIVKPLAEHTENSWNEKTTMVFVIILLSKYLAGIDSSH